MADDPNRNVIPDEPVDEIGRAADEDTTASDDKDLQDIGADEATSTDEAKGTGDATGSE